MRRRVPGVRRWFRLPGGDVARIGAEVDEEIGFHLDMRVQELIAEGLSEGEARRRAQREFGDVADARESLIASDVGTERRRTLRDTVEDAARDVRLGTRSLLRTPLFTAVAVATLGVGIGGATALFSVVDGVLLKPLPYTAPDRLVALSMALLNAEYGLLRERGTSYTQVGGYREGLGFNVQAEDTPVRVNGAAVSANLFATLGVEPLLGGGFSAPDETGEEPAVVLSWGMWQEHLGGAGDVIGRSMQVDGQPHRIAGVMPRGFAFPSAAARLWVPLVLNPANVGLYWGLGGTHVVARLRDGVSAEQARQEVIALASQMRLENPLWTPNEPYRADMRVEALSQRVIGDAGRGLVLLLGATLVVLLIACANVANLYVVRVTARERDLAVRAALGGGRAHIVRTLLAESGVIAVLGGALGVIVAFGALGVLPAVLPADTPRLEQVALDGRALLFTSAVALATALLFSLLPVLRHTQVGLHGAMKESGRRGGSSVRARRAARVVVVAEVALAVILLLGAGLLLRSLQALQAIDPGFRGAGVMAARVTPAQIALPDAARQRVFYANLLERLEGQPGVQAAAVTGQLPFDGELSQSAAAVEHVTNDPNELPVFDWRAVTPGFHAALGIPVLQGRAFDARDGADGERVAIVDERAAHEFWPGESPIGRRVGRPWAREWLVVVGVVGSVRDETLTGEQRPAIYVPFEQHPRAATTLVVRSTRTPRDVARLIEQAVRTTDASVPVTNVRPVDALVRASLAESRSLTLLLGAFAAVALLLGALGVYGVLAYSVEQRMPELGVRLALGATAAQVRAAVMREGGAVLAVGFLIGAPVALALAYMLRVLLHGVRPLDPVTFATALTVLAAAGATAAYLPARRASRVDPALSLRGSE